MKKSADIQQAPKNNWKNRKKTNNPKKDVPATLRKKDRFPRSSGKAVFFILRFYSFVINSTSTGRDFSTSSPAMSLIAV